MRWKFLFGALAAALVVALPSGVGAEDVDDALARGEFLFRAHCAACHGNEGRGDGPLVEDLRTPPGDLTLLRDDDGLFPAERARRFIDGREPIGGHGSREMPIWGITFQERSRPDEHEDEVDGRIDDLVGYLRSIQRTEEN